MKSFLIKACYKYYIDVCHEDLMITCQLTISNTNIYLEPCLLLTLHLHSLAAVAVSEHNQSKTGTQTPQIAFNFQEELQS